MDCRSNEDTSDSIQHEILMKKSIGKTSRHENNMDSVDSNKNEKENTPGHNGDDLLYSDADRDHVQVKLHTLHTSVLLHNL